MHVINNTPDGTNINEKCGSTHPEALMEYVVKERCDIGFAFDGDADRCLAVDENGNLVNGDFILTICAKALKEKGQLKDDTLVEIIYRDIKWIKGSIERTIVNCEADIGYTTCFISSIKNSIILYDKSNILKEMKNICSVEFPEELKKNIIRKNYPLLKDEMFSYYNQIKKALKRNDFISINHRVAALFASYFDIIFAFNKFLHPGEKKILKIIKDNNLTVPKNMEENVLNILKYSGEGNKKILDEIDELVKNLDKMF